MGIHEKERELSEIKEQYVKKSSCVLFVLLALLVGAFVGNTITMLYIGQQQERANLSQPVPPQQQSAPDQHDADPVALANIEREAMDDPTNAAKWVALGNFCFDHNLPAKAVTAYERALELSPMQVNVWSDLGVMYRRTKQFKKSVDAFAHAASLDKAHVTSRFNMGIIYLHDLNDPASALKIWKEVLSIDPNAKTPSGQSLADLVKDLENK
ncbi:tetratricopeptide repeat protein [Pseudodesulfovibrio sediminis]|uniref:Tetratricopeptide repeat protein n=1 Tax=Pseudodesulfovibrio sediminis TaxID=2810563 RepID=A0ABM7P2N4_9BACT|nr:hypothetical protein [Pseudodesulfovibrio sediminis]BCS87080.1 hypothetical protein PSDVSF_03220 [Pseudodesulfovibrio sediminis]